MYILYVNLRHPMYMCLDENKVSIKNGQNNKKKNSQRLCALHHIWQNADGDSAMILVQSARIEGHTRLQKMPIWGGAVNLKNIWLYYYLKVAIVSLLLRKA